MVLAALFGNLAIFIIKLAAAMISGSSAMLAEAFHSLSDTLNQVLLLIGLKLSARPPDERHPFGYGAEQYFWSLIVAMALFGIAGGLSVYEGLKRLTDPHEIEGLGMVYGTLAVSFVFESFTLFVAYREVRHYQHRNKFSSMREAVMASKDPVTTTVLFEDSLALTGLAIAFVAILGVDRLGVAWLDGLASLLIGLLLMFFSLFLARKVKGLLIGEAARPEKVAALKEAITAIEQVDKIEELRTMHLSPDLVLVNLEVVYIDGLDTESVARAAKFVDRTVTSIFPNNLCYVEGQKDN